MKTRHSLPCRDCFVIIFRIAAPNFPHPLPLLHVVVQVPRKHVVVQYVSASAGVTANSPITSTIAVTRFMPSSPYSISSNSGFTLNSLVIGAPRY